MQDGSGCLEGREDSTKVHERALQQHAGARRCHAAPRRPTKPHEGPRSPTKPHEAPRRPTKPHASLHRNKQQQDCSGISVWSFSCCRAEICNLAESGLSPPVPGEKPAPEQLSCRITSDTMPHLALRRKTQKRKSYHVFPGAALQMDLPCPTAPLTTCHRHRRRPHGT